MDLEMITTVREVSPKEKYKYMISLISGILKKKTDMNELILKTMVIKEQKWKED